MDSRKSASVAKSYKEDEEGEDFEAFAQLNEEEDEEGEDFVIIVIFS